MRTVTAYRRFFALVSICTLVEACHSESQDLEAVELADSAGIRWVLFKRLEQIDAPSIPAKLVYRTDPGLALFGVRSGRFLKDGSLLLANVSGSNLVLVGPNGSLAQTVGRKGEGPGEFEWPAWVDADDAHVWVYDTRLLRLTELSPDWATEATRVVTPSRSIVSLQPLSTLPDNALLAIHGENRIFSSGGERRDTVPLLRIGPTGTTDTLGIWGGQERAFQTISAGRIPVPVGFARTVFASGHNGVVLIGSSDSLLIERIGTSGSSDLVFRGLLPPIPTTESDVAAWRRAVVKEIPRSAGEALGKEIASIWAQGPLRNTLPAFGGLELDDEGRLWVGAYARPEASNRLWLIFDSKGRPVGRVQLPTQFAARPDRPVELLDARSGLVAILLRTTLDEEYIEVWRVGP